MASSNRDRKVHSSLSHMIEVHGLKSSSLNSLNEKLFVETGTLSVASRHSKNNAQELNPACRNTKNKVTAILRPDYTIQQKN